MPSQEVFEHWVTVGYVLGAVSLGVATMWLKNYHEARGAERDKVDRSPEIARRSVGAAFVDVSTAGDIRRIAHDTAELLKIATDFRRQQEHDDVVDDVLKEMGVRKPNG